MKIRGLLILLAILVGLAAFVYFYEIEGGKQRTEQEKAEKKILSVEESKVQEIAVFAADQQIRGKRDGTQWTIVQPLETEADQYEWNNLAKGLQDLSKDKELDIGAEDLKSYGLDKPRVRVVLKTKEGQEKQVLFGDDNPTQSFVYAKVPEKSAVYLVPSYSFRSFDKKLLDLRDKSVMKTEQAEVQEISLRNPDGSLQLIKKGEEWEIQSPIKAKADKSDVDSFLSSFSGSTAKELIDQPDPKLNTGLDKPTYELTLIVGKDRAIKKLAVGAMRPLDTPTAEKPTDKDKAKEKDKAKAEEKPKEIPSDATFYARDASRKPLLVVDKYFVDKLNKKLADFRDKSIAKFDRAKLKQIEIAFDSEQITLIKEKEDWLTPDKKKKAKSETVTTLLSAIEYGKAKSVMDPPYDTSKLGLDTPEVKLILEQEGSPKQELWLGKDGDDGTYAKMVSDATVKVLDKDVKSKVKVKASDLLLDNTPPPKK